MMKSKEKLLLLLEQAIELLDTEIECREVVIPDLKEPDVMDQFKDKQELILEKALTMLEQQQRPRPFTMRMAKEDRLAEDRERLTMIYTSIKFNF